MRISRDLNLVFSVDTDAGTVYVHSTPISYEVYEKYFLVLNKTQAAIYQEGLNVVSGPRAAALLLKRIAQQTAGEERGSNAWDGPDGVENGLMNEIRRLTNVVMPVGPLRPVLGVCPECGLAIEDGVCPKKAGFMMVRCESERNESSPAMAPGGWETVPLYDAVMKKTLSRQDVAEVEGIVCFFIVSSACHQRKVLPSFLDAMASLLDAQIVSSSVSEYARSLPTSTATESSGERAA